MMELPSRKTKYRRTASTVKKIIAKAKSQSTTTHFPTSSTSQNSSEPVNEVNLENLEVESDSTEDRYSSSSLENTGSEDDSMVESQFNLRSGLAEWATKNNITQVALSNLLVTLRPFVSQRLPLDARTLLQTPKHNSSVPQKLGNGEFYYFGIEAGIMESLQSGLTDFHFPFFLETNNLLTIRIGVDGLPLSKSSNSQLWPIMGILDQSIGQSVFLIAIFHGYSKPPDIFQYLSDFVKEMKVLESNGLHILGTHYNVRISLLLADAPVRAFLKQCSQFNSYFGCERCTQKGTWLKRITYLELDSTPRTDVSFSRNDDRNHHTGKSPLKILDIGLVSQVPLDHMHLLFLGVMRKLIFTWVKGKLPFRLGPRNVRNINQRILTINKHTPKEFVRKPRSLNDIHHFKATEWRTLLLYTGLTLLFDELPKERYNHFLQLQCASFILLSPNACNVEWNSFAKSLLCKFVRNIPLLYSSEYLVYNMHCLLHLHEDALKYGNLNNASCFPFENFMQILKRSTRGKKHIVKQIVNRKSELSYVKSEQTKAGGDRRSSRCLFWKSFALSTKSGDNCFRLKNDQIVIITEINKTAELVIKCKAFLDKRRLNNYPCNSEKLGIHRLKNSYSAEFVCTLDDIISKYYLVPMNLSCQAFIGIPLL